MNEKKSFSKRHGYQPENAEITFRNDAPEELRYMVIQIGIELGLKPSDLRSIICPVLRKRPDSNNWSEYPNIRKEIGGLLDECEWYRVYDIIEVIDQSLSYDVYRRREFEEKINSYFCESGIGWQLCNSLIEIRGSELFESNRKKVISTLEKATLFTTRDEINEAVKDISRRPEPDITGAIQHSMAALECLARDVTGDSKSTLGELIKKIPI